MLILLLFTTACAPSGEHPDVTSGQGTVEESAELSVSSETTAFFETESEDLDGFGTSGFDTPPDFLLNVTEEYESRQMDVTCTVKFSESSSAVTVCDPPARSVSAMRDDAKSAETTAMAKDGFLELVKMSICMLLFLVGAVSFATSIANVGCRYRYQNCAVFDIIRAWLKWVQKCARFWWP